LTFFKREQDVKFRNRSAVSAGGKAGRALFGCGSAAPGCASNPFGFNRFNEL
jgi:hypothetical protein